MVHVARHRSEASTWWIRPRSLAVLAVAAAGLATAVWLPGRNDVASATERTPQSFTDNFGAKQGDRVSKDRWLVVGGRDDARQDGQGNVVLGRVMATRKAFTQPTGHAEARIKVQRQAGPWRAFGVVSTNGRLLGGDVETIDPKADPTSGDAFHTYAIDWTPESVLWSVDGKPSIRLRRAESGALALVLNLATDGRRSARMVVDFVRVSGETPTPAPSTAAPTTAPATPSAKPTTSPAKPTTPPAKAPTTAPAAQAWAPFTDYAAGDLVTYKKVTYRVKEAHTSLPGWEPTALPNLFEKL